MVVKKTLGDVEDLAFRQADARQGLLEVIGRWLIAPDLLSGDNPVESNAESLIRAGKEVIVNVRDDR